jgi:hypothetical protein
LVTRHNLYRWRGEAGDVIGASDGFTELLADRIRVLGTDHPHALNAHGEITRWRGESSDVAAAVAILQDVLADRMRILGPNDPDTSTRFAV